MEKDDSQISEFYLTLSKKTETHLTDALKDQSLKNKICSIHNFSSVIENLKFAYADANLKQIVDIASYEYLETINASITGNTRHAYMSLRLFLEMGLASIYFSSNLFHLQKWLTSSGDIIWEMLANSETGVLSEDFISTFTPLLKSSAKQYREMAKGLYRECSQFIHGNIETHSNKFRDRNFSKAETENLLDKIETAQLIFLFAFFARYLGTSSDGFKRQTESTALEYFSFIPEVRAYYGG